MRDRPLEVHALVDSVIRLKNVELPPSTLGALRRALSFPNPAFTARLRMGRWTGDTPEEICLVERDRAGVVTLPRGAVELLQASLDEVGARLVFKDLRVRHEPLHYPLLFELRDYQEEAVEALVSHIQGVVVLPCGAGKSVIGAAAISRCQQPSLVIVHTHDLLEQWRGTLRGALGIEPGVIAEGRVALAEVVVATVQTLATLPRAELEEVGARFGTVVVDECHHVPASTFRDVLSALPALYRFGLTATPERSDGLTPLLNLTIGEPVYEVAHRRLVERGYLVIPKVMPIYTQVTAQAKTHHALIEALTSHRARNQRIVDLATECSFNRRATLILSGRVEHCERLAALLCEGDVAAAALTGHTPKASRGELLEAFREGELAVLCATSLADEGLDISRLERLILATPTRAEGRTIQRLGRLMRPHPGKSTPILYDLVDDHPMAYSQFKARRATYRKVLDVSQLGVSDD